MKLNAFGRVIQQVDEENLTLAKQAIESGWKPADHPKTCCPPDEPRRQTGNGRSIPENARLRDKALAKEKYHRDAADVFALRISTLEDSKPRFDHGVINIPLIVRTRRIGPERGLWEKYHYHTEMAEHYERLARKYQQRIEAAR